MNFAIVAGLARSQIKRINSFVQGLGTTGYLADWEVVYFPARRSTPEIAVEDVEIVMKEAAKYDRPHVIGVSKQDGVIRKRIARDIREYFRFRWLGNDLLTYLSSNFERFVAGINEVLQEEAMWSQSVRPQNLRSPLLLPQGCFHAVHPHSDLWFLSEQYGDVGNIQHAARAMSRFVGQYFSHHESGNPRKWIDAGDRVFDHTGARHGQAPFPRNWKYSYRFESGFHFDVSDRNARAFRFRDRENITYDVKNSGHVNVDPHGCVRKPL